jgi:hypothetical protein
VSTEPYLLRLELLEPPLLGQSPVLKGLQMHGHIQGLQRIVGKGVPKVSEAVSSHVHEAFLP